tara:strand:- start:165 stop:1811 length:1647 start_codon:yes stop_codon:yes gene_type:complete
MESNLTLVTGLFDIKRGELNDGFRRSFDHYIETFRRLIKTELPMVIYCDAEVEAMVWEEPIRTRKNTHIIRKTLDDLRNFPFHRQTNDIRMKGDWVGRSGWIPDSPQAKLELYNPLVMSKQFFLNDATIFNPFQTKFFLWIDAGIANTIGDPCNYFTLDFSRKITKEMNKMMYVCFPYDGSVEVHGFEKGEFNRLAGETTDRVARGGMFGGSGYAINQMNPLYYQMLSDTLNSGYMGTEESIFTLLTYQNPDLCNIVWIENNGLIIKALNDINNNAVISSEERLAVYALTFNLPKQFRLWVESFKSAFPVDFESVRKYVINNSNDPTVDVEYKAMFEEYGFEEFVFDNVGICGGRQFAAEHFDKSGHEYMIFFEDDMLLQQPGSKPCSNGFTTYHANVFDKSIDIMEMEKLDYLKLCFTEFYGDNHDNWAWYNVPQEKKDIYFPPKPDGSSVKSTAIKRTGSHRNLPYAVGEYHYCNWPVLFNKEGSKKLFLDEKYVHLYEQTWMSQAMTLIKQGKLNPGSLLATVINHDRVHHYAATTRRENEHYTN